jgi:hypothetical protein
MKRLIAKHIKPEVVTVLLFSTMISWSSWTGNCEGGDIAAARKSYLSFSPIDIWGGFSGIFYGNIPDGLFNWGINLLLFQLICTIVGLFFK